MEKRFCAQRNSCSAVKEYLSITCVGRAGEGSRALVQSMRYEAGKVDGSPDSEDLLLKEVGTC